MAKEALLAMNEPFVGYSVVKKYDDDVSFGSSSFFCVILIDPFKPKKRRISHLVELGLLRPDLWPM